MKRILTLGTLTLSRLAIAQFTDDDMDSGVTFQPDIYPTEGFVTNDMIAEDEYEYESDDYNSGDYENEYSGDDIDNAVVNIDDAASLGEKRKFNVPGMTDAKTHIYVNGRKRWNLKYKKNRKRIKMLNSFKSSPFGMLAARKTAMRKKTFKPDKVSRRFIDYGCWCFQHNMDSLNVPYVDAYDNVCKQLTRCEKCIAMDHPGEDNCDVSKLKGKKGYPEYNVTVSQDGVIKCENDKSSCQYAFCECHKQFALDFPTRINANRSYQSSRFNRKPKGRKHANGPTRKEAKCVPPPKKERSQEGRSDMDGLDFDMFRGLDVFGDENTTPASGLQRKPKRADTCCGSYPLRYPFSTFDGNSDHGCCGGKTYVIGNAKQCCGNKNTGTPFNPFVQTCCHKPTGAISSIGSCP